MSDNFFKISSLPKLNDDGSNWHSWKEKASTLISSKVGLYRHLSGRAKKPSAPVEKEGKSYKTADSLIPLSDDDAEAILDKIDVYNQREAEIRNIIYQCISETTLNAIKSKESAFEVWQELCRLF
ncbi:hypothetical protein DFH05DRAFT_1394147, partial [Lentinula detonsa]